MMYFIHVFSYRLIRQLLQLEEIKPYSNIQTYVIML